MSETLEAGEYVMAVARALNMPDIGIRRLSIEWEYGSPVIVHLEYIKMGEPAMLDVMPQGASVRVGNAQ